MDVFLSHDDDKEDVHGSRRQQDFLQKNNPFEFVFSLRRKEERGVKFTTENRISRRTEDYLSTG